MKYRLLSLLSLLLIASLSGCLRDECTSIQTYIRFEPIYKTPAEVRSGMSLESARALKSPGKIYAFGSYLFINEKQEGIHLIDNSDPVNPRQLAFWKIAGNVDMAVRGNYLYADQYVDLLTIDISHIEQPKVVCRAENVFPLYGFDPVNGYVIDYKETEVSEKIKCSDQHWNQNWFFDGGVLWINGGVRKESFGGVSNASMLSSIGIAGSYARFGISGEYLYTVDNSLLRSWSLATPSCPVRSDSTWLGWNTETIFPYKDRLFVGSQTGVFILDNRNPAHPVLEAQFDHATGCDPVVCDDQYAFVTIHDGTTCQGTFNQLDVVDLSNLPNASLLASYPMKHPFGLAITDKYLFLCDEGLKVFDRTNPAQLKELAHLNNIKAYDVIAFNNSHLLLIGDDGFFQYDVSTPAAPKQLSLIPVQK